MDLNNPYQDFFTVPLPTSVPDSFWLPENFTIPANLSLLYNFSKYSPPVETSYDTFHVFSNQTKFQF